MADLTQARLREVLNYDPATGIFTWRIAATSDVKAGDIAGHWQSGGYRQIGIDGRRYYAHRLAFMYMHGRWPIGTADHINCVKLDNRIANLRECPQHLNSANTAKKISNTHGFKGLGFNGARKKPWTAYIRFNYVKKNLGSFATPIEAAKAYDKAARKMCGEFARLNFPDEIYDD